MAQRDPHQGGGDRVAERLMSPDDRDAEGLCKLLKALRRGALRLPARIALLEDTASPEQIDPSGFDAIYFTGGHAVMWDFPD